MNETMRLERWVRIRQEFDACPPPGYDTSAPWDFILKSCTYGSVNVTKASEHFWNWNVIHPIQQWHSQAGKKVLEFQGDAVDIFRQHSVVQQRQRRTRRQGCTITQVLHLLPTGWPHCRYLLAKADRR